MHCSCCVLLLMFSLCRKFTTGSPVSPLINGTGEDVVINIEAKNCAEHPQPLCLDDSCIHIASTILSKIDRNLEPCDDFFRFACGSWMKENEHEINDDNLLYASNLNEMPAEVDKIMEDLVTEKRKIDEWFYQTQPFRDLDNFYKSCMNEEKIREEGYGPAINVLLSLKEFSINKTFDESSFNLSKALLELFKYNSSPLVHINLDTNAKNVSQWSPLILAPKHYGLLPSELIGKSFEKKINANSKILKSRAKLLKMKKIINKISKNKFSSPNSYRSENGKSMNNYLIASEDPVASRKDIKSQHGKPTKNTSFFSRIIKSNPVVATEKDFHNHIATSPKKPQDSDDEVQQPSETVNNAPDSEDPNVWDIFKHVINDELLENKDKNDSRPTNQGNRKDDAINSHRGEDVEEVWEVKDIIDAINASKERGEISNKEANDYNLFLMENEGIAKHIMSVYDVTPRISRQELYQGIQEESEELRKYSLGEFLSQEEFEDLFVFPQDFGAPSGDTVDPLQEGVSDGDAAPSPREVAIDTVVEFLAELKNIEPTEKEKVLAIQEGRIFNDFSIKSLESSFPMIEWRYILSTLYNTQFSDDDEVVVRFPGYLEKLTTLLAETKPWVVHYALLTLFAFDVLKELVTIDDDLTREEFCLTVTKETMKHTLSYMYSNYLGKDAFKELRETIRPMGESLREQTKRTFENSSILTQEDKKAAELKVDQMKWEIGGSDKFYRFDLLEKVHKKSPIYTDNFLENVVFYYNYSFGELQNMINLKVEPSDYIWSYGVTPFTVNAFHAQSLNSIVMPKAFFMPPYMFPGSPSYVKYGSVGMPIAHELVHAFDFTGSRFDHTGVSSMPFSESMLDGIRENVDCFGNLVKNSFSTVEHIEGLDVVIDINTNLTRNENFADIVGLDLAYKAYLHEAKKMDQPEPLLPGLPFTAKQLFFISFAQPYCALIPPLAKVMLMEIDEHLTHPVRINSLLMNYPEFLESFQCTKEHAMSPKLPTCQIF